MPKPVRRVALTLLLLAVAILHGAAAPAASRSAARFTIDSWQTDDGLPQSSVIAMTLSRDGYLWLGTLNGLVRFDGFRFPVFDENNTPGLASSRIVALFEDSHGTLWIGTEAAGVLRATADGRVTSVESGRGSREGRLRAVCEDGAGVIWLYTADGQLTRYGRDRADVFSMATNRFSYARTLAPTDDGGVAVGTDDRIYHLAPGGGTNAKELVIEQTNRVNGLAFLLGSRRGGYWRVATDGIQRWTREGPVEDLGTSQWNNAQTPVTAVCEDQNGGLVIGTLGAGVFLFETGGKTTHLSRTNGLSSDIILSLAVDREGTLWVGTDGDGLARVRRQLFDTLEPTRGQVVQSISEDPSGAVWVGYNNGGVDRWLNGELQKVDTGLDMTNMSVKAVLADRRNRVWAGTSSLGRPPGLFQLLNDRFNRVAAPLVFNRDVTVLHEDRQGRLWAGTRRGLAVWGGNEWKTVTLQDGLSDEDISALADDAEGDMWIGTRSGGLNRMRAGRIEVFHKADGLPGEHISALLVDGEGVLWIGTDGGGLGRWRGRQRTRYTTQDGLISNSVAYLLEDDQGALWIGSNRGLMRAEKRALKDFAEGTIRLLPIRDYGRSDGLPAGECTQGSQPAACRTRAGRLLFPTIRGLVSIDPAQLRRNTNPPPVTIESVWLEGRPQEPAGLRTPRLDTLSVPSGFEQLEFHYTSLNLFAPERARFRYRLEGHETAWTEAGSRRVAPYSKLPPGHYRFVVTACNEDGVWNELGAAVNLVVPPPFWRTWWFRSFSGIALLSLIVGVVRYFSVQKLERQLAAMRQQEALEKERARIARDIHDQLGASLTQVTLLGEMVEADKTVPEEVEAHARQICQTARDTTRSLDEIVWTVNPSNDTLEGLANYICKYAQDYLGVAGIRCRLVVPPELPPAPIPPEVRHNVFLAAKESVTNIVRHAHATSAWIRLRLEPGRLILEIADDGRGLAGVDANRAATRNGLRNMRKRMEDVGGAFEMGAAPEGGLQIRLIVPIRPE